jgi:SAM-dependent methyltransferase
MVCSPNARKESEEISEARSPSGVGDYYEDYWSSDGFAPDRPLIAPVRDLLERWTGVNDDCIDIGCGRGDGAGMWLSTHTRTYLGVDISETAVEAARERGLNAVQVRDASAIECDEASFDLAVCFEVLEHHFSPQLAASEVLRTLRPGGRFLVTVPNVAHWRRRADLAVLGRWNPLGDDQSVARPWRDPHIRFFGRTSLGRMLMETGFVDVRVEGLSGAFLSDLPGLRRCIRRPDTPSSVHDQLIRAMPGVFGQRLAAVAFKPKAGPLKA